MTNFLLAAILVLAATPVSASSDSDMTGYKFGVMTAEQKPDVTQDFLREVSKEFNDPESVRMESPILAAINPETKIIEMCAMVNAKNSFGGYAGAHLAWLKIANDTYEVKVGKDGSGRFITARCGAMTEGLKAGN